MKATFQDLWILFGLLLAVHGTIHVDNWRVFGLAMLATVVGDWYRTTTKRG